MAKNVGQDILEDLLSLFKVQEKTEQDEVSFHDPTQNQEGEIFTAAELALQTKLTKLIDSHGLRYAKIDWLYWYEFQNKCSDMLVKYLAYLEKFESNEAILKTQESQRAFVRRLEQFTIVITALFDIINCEKCTNVQYFALSNVSIKL